MAGWVCQAGLPGVPCLGSFLSFVIENITNNHASSLLNKSVTNGVANTSATACNDSDFILERRSRRHDWKLN